MPEFSGRGVGVINSLSTALARSTDKSARLVAWVFIGLVAVMAGWTAYVLWQQSRLTTTLETMVFRDVRMVQTTTDLLEAAYNRHQFLLAQIITNDTFERDALRLQYEAWGNRVGQARRRLAEFGLDKAGEANLARQTAMIPHIIVVQERVADLAAAERIAEAMHVVRTELLKLDAEFDVLVQELRSHERNKIGAYARQAQALAERMHQVSLVLGVAITFLVAWLGMFVLRALKQRGRAINDQALQLEAVGQKLIHDATYDALTGLANRRLFFQRLNQAIALYKRELISVGVAYIDLDQFKPINDQYGHAAGDELLKVVAHRLQSQLRGVDTIARLGGDEFALVLMHTSQHTIDKLIRDLRVRVCQPVELPGGGVVNPEISIGYALCPEHAVDAEALLNRADSAMYANKLARRQNEQ